MYRGRLMPGVLMALAATALLSSGCRNHMPHAFTWPASGDTVYTHPKPPEGGYYSNWDPYAVELTATPMDDVNPVQTQHFIIATVLDKNGKALPNRRVEWIINDGSVGDIVEVDESGWRASRGYKVTNDYAVSHTNNFDHVLDMGTDDTSDDIMLEKGQTWCVITSPIEGETYMTVYAPGIYDRTQHKVFVTKKWYDVRWEFPPPATNPIGTTHNFDTVVMKYSNDEPLSGYEITYRIVDGPGAVFEQSGGTSATVRTDSTGVGRVTLRQTTPAEGTNNIEIDIMRPANESCCEPPKHIATGMTAKTWIGPKIAITKTATPRAMVGEQFNYSITVSNPSQVDATNVVVTDVLPDGIQYVSSTPSASASGQQLNWSLGTLGPGGESTIGVVVTGTRTGSFDNCADVRADMNLSDRDCANTVITAPALVVEKTCTPMVSICDEIQYTATVRNTGDGTARNVRLTDNLPEGLATPAGNTTVSADIGDLGPGQAKQVNYTAKASRPGSFTNTVQVVGEGGLSASDSCSTTVSQPVLSVSKTGRDVVYIGRTVDYSITVSNSGDTPARDVILTDTMPAGLSYVSASDGGSSTGGGITWNLGTIEPGGSRTVQAQFRAQSAGTARNTATARGYCCEATDDHVMEIKGIPAVLLEVVDVEDPDEIGTTETYIITVTNQGSAVDTNIRITAEVQPEAEYVSSEGPGVSATADGRTITFSPLPSLAPKARATYRVVVRGTTEGDTRFKVSLTTDQLTRPVEETESTRFY